MVKLTKHNRTLIAHILHIPLAQLYTQTAIELDEAAFGQYTDYQKRLDAGEPFAYITGKQDFWSLTFSVTPAVLIPRPETELLVEHALAFAQKNNATTILDLATGSGCIAISLKHENPHFDIVATDICEAALNVASDNATRLKTPITFQQSNWYERLSANKFDIILSNPPYIACDDPHLAPETRFEPMLALIADHEGLKDIETIVAGAPSYLTPGGLLCIEHGFAQGERVRAIFEQHGFVDVTTVKDYAGHDRFCTGVLG